MTPEVFILGTSHLLQCGTAENRASVSLLEEEIRRVLSEYGIRSIAEEVSCDGLREKAGGKSLGPVCQRIAGDDIPVHFVDLDKEERAGLKLSNAYLDAFILNHAEVENEWGRVRGALSEMCGQVRERVWVARVLALDEWPVLLVCGADHVVSVGKLFSCIGVRATVVHRDFDPDEYTWMKSS